MFWSKSMKTLFIVGVVLVIAASLMMSILFSFPQIETLKQVEVNFLTRYSYYSENFRAENGYWLDLDIHTTDASTLIVRGQQTGDIYQVSGDTFQYRIFIPVGDVYEVIVANNDKGHWHWFTWIDPIEINVTGNFYLRRTPTYCNVLMYSTVGMLLIGALATPLSIYVDYRTKQIAKSSRKCPRCGYTVSIGTKVCPNCGIDLMKYWIKCKYCRKLYNIDLGKCPYCGARND